MATAAIPTPPAAACTSSFCPGRAPARSARPYQAVANATGTDAARANDQPSGIGASSRASVTATGPNPPPVVMPATRSPAASPVTPGPVSRTTPASSLPMIPPPGIHAQPDQHVPEVQPGGADRDPHLPGLQRRRDACGHGTSASPSSVPVPVASSRHGAPSSGGVSPAAGRLSRRA